MSNTCAKQVTCFAYGYITDVVITYAAYDHHPHFNLRQGVYVIVVVCLFASNFAHKLLNGFE